MFIRMKDCVLAIGLIIGTLSVFPSSSRCEVLVFDRVTTVDTPVRITVLTKGRFFAQGGRRVDIYLDENHLQSILTGGDGYGYLKYTPQSAGFKHVTARSKRDKDRGLILVMKKNEKAILVEIEAAFKYALMSENIRENSQQAVKTLSQKYKIIYLSKYAGKGISREWLDREQFPKSVILRWRDPRMLTALKDKGVHLHAAIGSAALMSAAENDIEHRYTFEESKKATTVNDWDEILKLLQ